MEAAAPVEAVGAVAEAVRGVEAVAPEVAVEVEEAERGVEAVAPAEAVEAEEAGPAAAEE